LEDASDVRAVFWREACQQEIMLHVIEESLNIPFNNPLWSALGCQQREELRNGIPGGPLWAEPVGVGLKLHLPFRLHGEFVQGLSDAVTDRRNAEWPEFAVLLPKEHAADGQWAALQVYFLEQAIALRRGRVDAAVHARGLTPPVFLRDEADGEELGVITVTKEPFNVANGWTIMLFDCVGELAL
jgi:hypothetical protein